MIHTMKKYYKLLSTLFLLILFMLIACMIITHKTTSANSTIQTLFTLLTIGNLFMFIIINRLYRTAKNQTHHTDNRQSAINKPEDKNAKHLETESKTKNETDIIKNITEPLKNEQNPAKLAELFLSKAAKEFDIVQGIIYKFNSENQIFELIADYAYYGQEPPQPFKTGEGLNGQVAKDKKLLYLKDLPENYRIIVSGLGSSAPKYMAILPAVYNNTTAAIVEISLLSNIDEKKLAILQEILNNIAENFK